jgi:hypothetical protein
VVSLQPISLAVHVPTVRSTSKILNLAEIAKVLISISWRHSLVTRALVKMFTFKILKNVVIVRVGSIILVRRNHVDSARQTSFI